MYAKLIATHLKTFIIAYRNDKRMQNSLAMLTRLRPAPAVMVRSVWTTNRGGEELDRCGDAARSGAVHGRRKRCRRPMASSPRLAALQARLN